MLTCCFLCLLHIYIYTYIWIVSSKHHPMNSECFGQAGEQAVLRASQSISADVMEELNLCHVASAISRWLILFWPQELEQFAMQPSSFWPHLSWKLLPTLFKPWCQCGDLEMPQFAKCRPPLLPPRPVLPGDTGWDERIRHVAEPRRGLADCRVAWRSIVMLHYSPIT